MGGGTEELNMAVQHHAVKPLYFLKGGYFHQVSLDEIPLNPLT